MELRPFNLVSPFPESQLPCVYDWIKAYKETLLGDRAPETPREFVAEFAKRRANAQTWAVQRDGVYGGYIEFSPMIGHIGYCEALFKKSFWGHERTLPVLDDVMGQIFGEDDTRVIFFQPFQHNKAIRSLVKELGAREIGDVPYGETRDGKPVNRTLFGLVAEQWQERMKMRNTPGGVL